MVRLYGLLLLSARGVAEFALDDASILIQKPEAVKETKLNALSPAKRSKQFPFGEILGGDGGGFPMGDLMKGLMGDAFGGAPAPSPRSSSSRSTRHHASQQSDPQAREAWYPSTGAADIKSMLGTLDMIINAMKMMPQQFDPDYTPVQPEKQTAKQEKRESATRTSLRSDVRWILTKMMPDPEYTKEARAEVVDWIVQKTLGFRRNGASSDLRDLIDNLAGVDLTAKVPLKEKIVELLDAVNETNNMSSYAYDAAWAVPVWKVVQYLTQMAEESAMGSGGVNMTNMATFLRDLADVPFHGTLKTAQDLAMIFEEADRAPGRHSARRIAHKLNVTTAPVALLVGDLFFGLETFSKNSSTFGMLPHLANVFHDLPDIDVNSTTPYISLGDFVQDVGVWSEQGQMTKENMIPRFAQLIDDVKVMDDQAKVQTVHNMELAKLFLCNLRGTEDLIGCKGVATERPSGI